MGVPVGTESPDSAILVPIRLEALEDLLGIVQHGSRRVQSERPVGHDCRVVPAISGRPGGDCHVVGEVHAESRIGQNCVAFALAARLGVRPEFELKAHICRFR